MNKQPIGIFDSGVGGLSIWSEIKALLPNENTIYLADSANAPYGNKTTQEIVALCIKNTELLISKGCKLIVVACNTATTNAISVLRARYKVPFIGIEPAIKPASLQTKTNRIGILATKGTLNSRLFAETSKKHLINCKIIEQVGEGLVPLIENGKLHSNKTKQLLVKYIQPMLDQEVDCLVLGCTHYPFLIPMIQEMTNGKMTIIDSGLAVARQTKAVLIKENMLATLPQDTTHQLYSNTQLNTIQILLASIPKKKALKFKDF